MTLFHACCRTNLFILLTLFIGLGMAFSTAASDAQNQAASGSETLETYEQPELHEQPVVLDEAALKTGIAHRLRTARGAKDDRFTTFTADQVAIEGIIPVHTPEITWFAVKLRIQPMATEAKPEFITLVVDQTGTLQIGSIQDLATGADLMKDAVDHLQTVDIKDLPPEFGKEIFSGPGPHTIIAISDPFCPHCRQAWDHIKLNLDRIKTLRLAHFPLNQISEAACLVMADAFVRQIQVFDVIDFTYSLLNKTQDPQEIIPQYMAVFPKLTQTWGEDPASALAYLTQTHQNRVRTEQNTVRALGIHSTPIFFVNDTFIKGFKVQEMEDAMP
jgi:protein-disulfide isomerase